MNSIVLASCIGVLAVFSPALARASEAPPSETISPEATRVFLAPIPEFGYIEVRSPSLPSLGNATDYLPAIAPPPTRIVLRLQQRRVYLYQGEEVLGSYPVAIGRSDTPTPTGEFEVFQMIENPRWQSPWTGEVRPPGPNSALGLRWIGFAHRPNGIVGFHGTPTLSSIGQAASNGCVRMRNEDVVALFEQVAIGTRVVVEP
ncbi:MAG TPA: L,D-transpeptidase [Crinalium sp.]|jgi:lipoprotein-anchoring transpeptidase ErfK/SrfK